MDMKIPLCAIALAIITLPSEAVEQWQPGNAYTQGSEICYKNILYKARWWATPGEEPGSSQWGAWVADVASKSCDKSLVKVESLEQEQMFKSVPTILNPYPHEKNSTE